MALRTAWRLVGCAAIAVGLLGACTYGHQEAQSGPYQPLVFPGEARIGASAFMVIDSNQILIGDELERYDLHADRVQILFVDDLGAEIPTTLRSVFTIESGRATDDAELRPNTWATVALFDLPDEFHVVFEPPYPKHARLLLEVDGSVVPEFEGVIWIVGTGGAPTDMVTPALALLEQELQPQTMVRLRARDAGAEGFEPSWTIGALTAQIRYDNDCFTNLRVHAGSEAIGGGAFLSTAADLDGVSGGYWVVDLFLTHPRGFTLPSASTADLTRLGQGPILDLVFDRVESTECALADSVEIHNLVVARRDGSILLSRRDVDPEVSDSSEFFYLHYVEPGLR